ncbi:hypothetical protein TgHK011_005766 [Trichoderma gracile]|nr:hypothetical protein TgHK011_005766 [Trichoderma gracile]
MPQQPGCPPGTGQPLARPRYRYFALKTPQAVRATPYPAGIEWQLQAQAQTRGQAQVRHLPPKHPFGLCRCSAGRRSLFIVPHPFFPLISESSYEILPQSKRERESPGSVSAGDALDPGQSLTKQQQNTHAPHLTACAIITLLTSNGVSSLALRSSCSTGLDWTDRDSTSTDLVTALAEGFSRISSRGSRAAAPLSLWPSVLVLVS